MNLHVLKKGQAGLAELMGAAGKSEFTIIRYLKGLTRPSAHTAYKLALACGCTQDEAVLLAQEPRKAKETA